jgi:hypothetical protein
MYDKVFLKRDEYEKTSNFRPRQLVKCRRRERINEERRHVDEPFPCLHCKEPIPKNSKQILPEKELRGHGHNFHIYVSVSDLYIPTIDLPILLQQKPRRGRGLRQINTCRKVPLQVYFFR